MLAQSNSITPKQTKRSFSASRAPWQRQRQQQRHARLIEAMYNYALIPQHAVRPSNRAIYSNVTRNRHFQLFSRRNHQASVAQRME